MDLEWKHNGKKIRRKDIAPHRPEKTQARGKPARQRREKAALGRLPQSMASSAGTIRSEQGVKAAPGPSLALSQAWAKNKQHKML